MRTYLGPALPASLVLLALLALLGGCSPSAGTPEAAAQSQPAGEYVIGPGDRLNVFVYQAPDLTVSGLPVRPDGMISVPLVSDVRAAGRTPTELGAEITKRLSKYVQDPVVTVMVESFVGPFDRQIRVVGEAVQPLAIAYRDHMTVLDVMIEAKGLTQFAAGNRAVVVRHAAGGKEVTIPVRLADLLRDGDISRNIEMRPGDVLIIPQSWF